MITKENGNSTKIKEKFVENKDQELTRSVISELDSNAWVASVLIKVQLFVLSESNHQDSRLLNLHNVQRK